MNKHYWPAKTAQIKVRLVRQCLFGAKCLTKLTMSSSECDYCAYIESTDQELKLDISCRHPDFSFEFIKHEVNEEILCLLFLDASFICCPTAIFYCIDSL